MHIKVTKALTKLSAPLFGIAYFIKCSKFATFTVVHCKELLTLLKQDGWIEKTQKGSHLQLIHPVKTGKVTVPMHKGDIPKGTLHAIFKQAGLK